VSVSENNAVEFGRFEEQISLDVSAYRVMHVNSPWLGVIIVSRLLCLVGLGISTVLGRLELASLNSDGSFDENVNSPWLGAMFVARFPDWVVC